MMSKKTFVISLVFLLEILRISPLMASRTYPTAEKITEMYLRVISQNIRLFHLRQKKYPQTYEELISALNDGEYFYLQSRKKQCDGIYFLIPIEDSWKQEYRYLFPGVHNLDSFDVLSVGQDGQLGTDDDINNWDDEQSWRKRYSPDRGWLEECFWFSNKCSSLFWAFMLFILLLDSFLEWLAERRKQRKN